MIASDPLSVTGLESAPLIREQGMRGRAVYPLWRIKPVIEELLGPSAS
jgi:hypothetical protein